jgi:hypothetical protein
MGLSAQIETVATVRISNLGRSTIEAIVLSFTPSMTVSTWYLETDHDQLSQAALLNSALHKILWCIDPLLGNDCETNNKTAVARQQLESQWTGWKGMFSAMSALMAAH